jgi:hypothetical protein
MDLQAAVAALPDPPGKAAAAIVVSTAASLSVNVPGHAQLRVALGVRPRANDPVPIYYSAVGAALASELLGPVGVRGGLAFYPAGFNDWLPYGTTSFDGASADLDVTLSGTRQQVSGVLPFVGLGGRVTHLTPRDRAQPAYATYSLSFLLGVRVAGGLTVEARYPLPGLKGKDDPPAEFETTLGLWWAI